MLARQRSVARATVSARAELGPSKQVAVTILQIDPIPTLDPWTLTRSLEKVLVIAACIGTRPAIPRGEFVFPIFCCGGALYNVL